MTISHFDGINYPRYPLNNVSPFTYRDGLTFLEVLEGLRGYITDTVVPGVNANFDLITQNYLDALDQMEAEKVAALASMQSQYDSFTSTANGKYAELDALYDQYMADVSASLRALNEPEVTALVNDDASTVSVALNGKYVRKGSLSVTVRDYGVVGDGIANDYWGIQAALNAAQGMTVLLDSDVTYLCQGTLTVPSGTDSVSIRATGTKPAILKLGVDGQSYPAIKFNQPDAAATTVLAASVSHGDHRWQVASTAGIEPGMLCEVLSSKSWYYDPRPESSDARKSELHRVARVETDAVWFDDPANDGYDTSVETVTLTFRRPIKVRLENIVVVGTLPATATETKATIGVEIAHADSPELINVSAENCARTGVRAFLCYRPTIRGGYTARANDYYNGYGVSIDGCSYATVADRIVYGSRRAVDVTGQQVVSRHTTIRGCTALGGGTNSRGELYGWDTTGLLAAEQYGFGSHGPADHTEYIANRTVGIKRPYSLRGGNERVIDLQHVGPTHGGVVQVSYGRNLQIIGGSAIAGWWGPKLLTRFNGLTTYKTRPDSLLRVYPTYQANPTSGTTYGRIVVKGVTVEVQDTFIYLEPLSTVVALPLGHVAVADNDVLFWPGLSTDTAQLLFFQGTDSGTSKARWFIGPNRMTRDSTGNAPVVATNLILSGARVLDYSTAT